MTEIGHIYTLPMLETTANGVFLDADNLGKVLLPRRSVPAGLSVGDKVKVFLYLDSEDRLVANTRMPTVTVGQFAYLPVVDVNEVGAFLDWGLEKDLLVPYMEQHRPMQQEQSYLVYVYVDKVHGRIVASSKIERFLDDDRRHYFRAGQPVDLIIANSTELGHKAIINHTHWGVLHAADVGQRLSFGQSIKGYIKHIRPDARIDLALQSGKAALDQQAAKIRTYLEKQGGFAPLSDKSDPEQIKKLFGMSKSAFKKSIGILYKERIIDIEKTGIRLVSDVNQS